MDKTTWRTEPVLVENSLDELRVGVKGQSNLEIAGSPRNIFRYSLAYESNGGKALNGLGALPGYQTQSNSECRYLFRRRQAVGDKLHCREGNNPDHQLRSLIHAK